jgi:hypothetical protein
VFIESPMFSRKSKGDISDYNQSMFSFASALSRLAISAAVMSAVSSLPLVTWGFAGPLKSVFGIYGQPAAGHDFVRITEKANNRIGVNLKLYYSNGHTCQLNKDGKWSDDHVAIIAEALNANQPCRLNLFFENHRVLLKDDGLQCAPVYCGTRGKLDDTSLPKFSPNRK